MYRIFQGPFKENAHVLLQRAGYAAHRFSGELSYTKRLSGALYPRFHVYPEVQDDTIRLNLHLDMKQHTYEGFSRHQGEYDGRRVEQEMERLVTHFLMQRGVAENESPQKPRKKLFGLF